MRSAVDGPRLPRVRAGGRTERGGEGGRWRRPVVAWRRRRRRRARLWGGWRRKRGGGGRGCGPCGSARFRELKLRNYEPEDEELKKRKVPQAKPASVEDKVKDQLEAAKPEPIIDEVDLANLAPRKPDWDLKRDVAKKLEKLEKRTQRAIAELIRERLKGQEEDLASAVGSAKQEGSDSD
ncbi:coiled-coil domain-containing protein 12 isoform X1 [Falco biarmicus]|uniref:coiled-coil domain-containing protein 12 isoform X1 n=1 Tax=Falco biarmicus TaxID=345155 RepID=UPI0024BD3F8E|nr:coiled-coil domain-containing protein 12 isoform X1 [Falco biarmicus]